MGYTEKEILDWMAGLGLTKSPLPPSGRVLEVEHLKNLRWECSTGGRAVVADVEGAEPVHCDLSAGELVFTPTSITMQWQNEWPRSADGRWEFEHATVWGLYTSGPLDSGDPTANGPNRVCGGRYVPGSEMRMLYTDMRVSPVELAPDWVRRAVTACGDELNGPATPHEKDD